MSRSYRTKPWYKPPKDFKKIRKRIRRAQDMENLRKEDEPVLHKKDDVWQWT